VSAGPPVGPTLGALGVNIGEVIKLANEKTASFNGMQVPIKINVDEESKEFDIEVGLPPTSALLKAEEKKEKGSGNMLTDKVADLRIEQIIKVAKMKEEGLLGMDMFARVKEILGSANSAGILVEGKPAKDVIALVTESPLKEKIEAEKTELTEDELKELEAERVKLQAAIEKRKQAEEATAQKIMDSMSGKSRSDIKKALEEAGVSAAKINELLPSKGAEEGAPGKPGEAQGAAK
jgi:large subunit ribosomal protein L11